MLRRLVVVGVITGALAEGCAAILQQIDIIPLIVHAEGYEAAALTSTGSERTAHMVLADFVIGIGFGAMFNGAISLARVGGPFCGCLAGRRGRVLGVARRDQWLALRLARSVMSSAGPLGLHGGTKEQAFRDLRAEPLVGASFSPVGGSGWWLARQEVSVAREDRLARAQPCDCGD